MTLLKSAPTQASKQIPKFPPFDLKRLITTIFNPQKGEKVAVLIDLDNPKDVQNLAFLKGNNPVQKKAYDVFYKGIHDKLLKELHLGACDLYAYKKTGGSNLELPENAVKEDGTNVNMQNDIYSKYDIIFCITDYSATAPLTASSKKYGFRGTTMHGLNDIILQSGLAVDYNVVSRFTEALRAGMTGADSADIDFEYDHKKYHLHLDLAKQEAQKSHGICHHAPDVVNLPAGEVYFVPRGGKGDFPHKFSDGTIGLMHVENGRINKATLLKGDKKVIDEFQHKLDTDAAVGVLGELGFGTQVLPYSGSDIQDEKIFGTFHIATGRNDHLSGDVVLKSFKNPLNATHEDILYSTRTTPEITIRQVKLNLHGKSELIIENYEPQDFLWKLLG